MFSIIRAGIPNVKNKDSQLNMKYLFSPTLEMIIKLAAIIRNRADIHMCLLLKSFLIAKNIPQAKTGSLLKVHAVIPDGDNQS